MNQLFVARYTSSRNGVEADVIILLQSIEGDLGVLMHRILLAQCLGLCPEHKPQRWWLIGGAGQVAEPGRGAIPHITE